MEMVDGGNVYQVAYFLKMTLMARFTCKYLLQPVIQENWE